MTKFTFTYLNNYRNHGQNAEQSIRFLFTGEVMKADSLPYDKGSDILNYQIKSARATVCEGTDLEKYLELDASTAYIYATKDGTAYVMTKDEYIAFVKQFATVGEVMKSAFKDYIEEIQDGTFPAEEHTYTIDDEIISKLY